MPRDLAIRLSGIGKRYRIGAAYHHTNIREHLMHLAGAPYRRLRHSQGDRSQPTIWALRDVSLEVDRGDVLGIVGRNGAGKSTLLKILSRITDPTEGEVEIHGRVGSLLEVGTGFHGELTGRENVFLNGAILGMRKSEIARKFDDIVDFAEIGEFIDTPVKRYSSGMYVRLAFAVAAHLEPEILIVDEVLSVGDIAFQKKSLGKMNEAAKSGRTVLFVSHNMQAVKSLCTRAILLEEGRLLCDGSTEEVLRRYLASLTDTGARKHWLPEQRPGNEQLRLVEVRVSGRDGLEPTLVSSSPISVTLEVEIQRVPRGLCVGFDLLTFDGTLVFRTFHSDAGEIEVSPGRNAFECVIPAGLLNGGRYLVSPRIAAQVVNWVVQEDSAVQFDVVFDHGSETFVNAGGRPGILAPRLHWHAEPAKAALVEAADRPSMVRRL